MVDIGGINDWDAGALERLSGTLNGRTGTLVELGDQLNRIKLIDGWEGDTREAALQAFDKIVDELTDSAAQTSAIKRLTNDTEDAVTALKGALAELMTFAFANDFAVLNDNNLWDRWAFETPPGQTDAQYADRQRLKTELRDRIDEIVRRGTEIENYAISVMNAATANTISDNGSTDLRDAVSVGDGQGAIKTPQPPTDGSPAENNQWWKSLTDEQREYVLAERPRWVGDLDGIPGADRSTANLAQLEFDRSNINGQVNEAQARFDRTGTAFDESTLRLAEDKLASLEAVEKEMYATNTDGSFQLDAAGERILLPERQLLAFDASPEHSLATAIVAAGDIDTADHVSVHTPGFTSTVNGGLANLVADADKVRTLSEWQLDRYSSETAGQTVASVAYFGYEAPQSLDVISDGRAEVGGERLASFLNGIDASRTDDPHLTAVGHSYGSLATGIGLQHGTGADDAVFMGSPGVGTDNLNDLEISGGAYTLASDGDIVAVLGQFDGDPREIPGITDMTTRAADVVMPDGTAIELVSTDRNEGGMMDAAERAKSHSDYYKQDTTSQFNQAAVIAGIPDVAVTR